MAGEEEARLHHIKLAAALLHLFEPLGHIGLFHKAVMQHSAEKPIAHICIFTAFVRIDIGHICNIYGQDNHSLMQHLVVFDIVQ